MSQDTPHTSGLEGTLQPLGLVCGGYASPLQETWIDLTSPHQVLYGLNGAGKTTILNSLRNALTGYAGAGKILARIPFEGIHNMRIGRAITWMLADEEFVYPDEVHKEFVIQQTEALRAGLAARRDQRLWEIDGTPFNALDWDAFADAAAASEHWLFSPTGTDSPQWSVSPVVLVDSVSSKWSQHLRVLENLWEDGEILITGYGLDLVWSGRPPTGAPAGIVTNVGRLTTGRDSGSPYWPLGYVVSDDGVDSSERVRHHLLTEPNTGWGERLEPLVRDAGLEKRLTDIERRANLILGDLLAQAPALHLSAGDDAAWFAGRSCSWTATRFEGDQSMQIERLSFAEKRWADIAIALAIADLLTEGEAHERAGATWLILDEPERGLHRTAEAHMANGVRRHVGGRVRTALATHSPDLLDDSAEDVSYVRRRSDIHPGAVIPMRSYERLRDDLGLKPSDMLGRTRGIALLEGEHDLQVLEGMLGADLKALGIMLLPTRGATKLKTVVDSRFLYEFTDAVLFPILDDFSAAVTDLWATAQLEARTQPASTVSEGLRRELKASQGKGTEFLEEFLSVSLARGTFDRVQPLGIPQTDVLLCLPVSEFVPTATSWEDLRQKAHAQVGHEPSETEFKKFLAKTHNVDLSPENIRRIAENAPPHPDIKALLSAMAARLEVDSSRH